MTIFDTRILIPGSDYQSCYQDLGTEVAVPTTWYQGVGDMVCYSKCTMSYAVSRSRVNDFCDMRIHVSVPCRDPGENAVITGHMDMLVGLRRNNLDKMQQKFEESSTPGGKGYLQLIQGG